MPNNTKLNIVQNFQHVIRIEALKKMLKKI